MHRNADIKTVTRSRAFNHDGGAVVTSTAAAKVKRCWWCLLVHQETAALMRAAQLTGILSKSQYTVECNIHVQKKMIQTWFSFDSGNENLLYYYYFFSISCSSVVDRIKCVELEKLRHHLEIPPWETCVALTLVVGGSQRAQTAVTGNQIKALLSHTYPHTIQQIVKSVQWIWYS